MHDRSNHMTLSEHKNENFQNIEKVSIHACFRRTRLKYLNTIMCFENTDLATILTKVRNEVKQPQTI